MTPAKRAIRSWTVVDKSRERTARLPPEVLNLLSTWHELGIYIELSTPPGDQMAVLHTRMLRLVRQDDDKTIILTCDPKSRIRMVSN